MRYFLLLSTSLLVAGLSFGQGANGTITGTIIDPNGAAVAGAPIEVRNTGTGTLAKVVSSDTGNYTLPQLPIGTYDLTVAVSGFKTYSRQGLDLAAAQVMRIDVKLDLGSSTETVTVTADASLLKTENSAVAQNVTVSQLDNLPILSVGGAGSNASSGFRDPFALAQMIPGSQYGSNGVMIINGTPNLNTQVRIDGQVSGNLGGLRQYTAQQQPSTDAIQEVAVQTSNYAAEFGTVGGGIFNASMKSGTNNYHGTAYDYSTNEAVNAHTPYTGLRNQQHRWDYGFTFGGPVRIPKVYNGTNKTFFFFSFEQFFENLAVNSTNATVPTAQYRAGDFSQLLTSSGLNGVPVPIQIGGVNYVDPAGVAEYSGMIFDPSTTRTIVCNTALPSHPTCTNGQSYQVADPYPNNMIPASQFDPVSLKVLGLVPLPKGVNAASGQLSANYQNTWVSHRLSNLPSIKLDQTTGSKGRLSGYWQSTGTNSQYSFPNGNEEGLPDPISAARGTFIFAKVIRANYDYTLSPTTVLHLGAGWNSLSFDDHAPNINFNPITELGLTGATVIRNFPNIISGFTTASGGMSPLGPAVQGPSFERRPSGSVNLTKVRSNHTYKIGAEWRLEKYPSQSFTSTAGQYTFGNNTIQPALQGITTSNGSTGFAFASFLTGGLSAVTLAAPTDSSASKQQWGLFAQDSWKVTRTLTLDLGLRWDYGTYYHEQYGRFENFSPTTPNPAAGGHPGAQIFEATCGCQFASPYPYAIGPRVGFAYQIDKKTVLRGGFGIVYTATNNITGTSSNTATTTSVAAGSGQIVGLFRNGVPASVQPVWPNFSPNAGQAPGTVVGAPTYIDPNVGRPAKQYQWSIGLQREINRNLVVEASYVANRGSWWPTAGLSGMNVLSQQDLARYGFTDFTNSADSALLTKTISSLTAADRSNLAARGVTLPYSNFPTNQTVRQSLLPFPQYTGAIAGAGAPNGKTWYDSLQTSVTQRFSHGLSVNANYTYSKNLELMNAIDIFNRDNGKQLSVNDIPNQFRVTGEYQTPNLAKSNMKFLSNKVVANVIGGWGLGWYLQYQSAPALARPASAGTLPIENFFGRGFNTGSTTQPPAQLKVLPDGSYMNPYSVDWTDYSGRHHTDPLDINCHCFDPTKTIVLNPNAWESVPNGQWPAQQGPLRFYRGIRTPQENANISRNFRIKERVTLNVRAEFQNVTNRTRLQTNAATPVNLITTTGFTQSPTTFNSGSSTGLYSGGFGTLVPISGTPGARSATLIGRVTF